jgi:hypothetical protein
MEYPAQKLEALELQQLAIDLTGTRLCKMMAVGGAYSTTVIPVSTASLSTSIFSISHH